ncbi:thiamine diphosphokinase [Schleiferilactobacillus shenzhenensis]|uniref:Thiamine diphosphokinase n=1 Tax=Schleiferilactobacillus shenzhenensis LY-73 TaxID=1231336 RepID=U4TUN4_9LACO|nr:thiamine diphosphokinase [Schleiferilactobacillus shenzhenensis]ERL65583.1 thiamine pyrophosphokinase [Schleiferilactobacillus shenzhenensis LY-73]
MKHIGLMLGGPEELWPAQLASDIDAPITAWVGVDRGSLRLLERGITPVTAVGDYDSLKPAERHRVEHAVHDMRYAPPEKDDTDSELGLQVAFEDLRADAVTIFGATGGRLDHLLVNLFMMAEPRFKAYAPHIAVVDRQNLIRFFLPPAQLVWPRTGYPYIGFVNLTPVTDFSIRNAKYPLMPFASDYPVSWASNEFLGEQPIQILFSKGIIAGIYSKD